MKKIMCHPRAFLTSIRLEWNGSPSTIIHHSSLFFPSIKSEEKSFIILAPGANITKLFFFYTDIKLECLPICGQGQEPTLIVRFWTIICGLYYKHILMIVSDDRKWCLYYKCAYDHNWALASVVNYDRKWRYNLEHHLLTTLGASIISMGPR